MSIFRTLPFFTTVFDRIFCCILFHIPDSASLLTCEDMCYICHYLSSGDGLMAATIAVHIPEALFHKLKRAADLTHRSVEDLAVTSLEAVLPAMQDLPLDVANDLAAM